jgi:HAD superfamily hydrolase (TIGR01509 family)
MDQIKVAVLDIDGTLLLSNEAHAHAFVEAAAALGLKSDFQTVLGLIGKGSDKLIPEAFGFDAESDLGKALDSLKGKVFKTRYLPTLEPAPGARELLTRLRQDGIELVVATSASEEDVAALLARAAVKDLITDAASGEDVAASKPAPDVVTAALKKLDAKPQTAVMLGDTPYDIEAATRAGVAIIAVRCGGWTDKDLQGAIAIYDHPADLLSHYDQGIFGRSRR